MILSLYKNVIDHFISLIYGDGIISFLPQWSVIVMIEFVTYAFMMSESHKIELLLSSLWILALCQYIQFCASFKCVVVIIMHGSDSYTLLLTVPTSKTWRLPIRFAERKWRRASEHFVDGFLRCTCINNSESTQRNTLFSFHLIEEQHEKQWYQLCCLRWLLYRPVVLHLLWWQKDRTLQNCRLNHVGWSALHNSYLITQVETRWITIIMAAGKWKTWLLDACLSAHAWHFRVSLPYCRCGSGSKGTRTVDGIDQCCKAHDACYQNIAYVSYNWVCQNAPGTAAYRACMCDKTAAQCFAANTYNSYWKGRCQWQIVTL